MAEKESVAARAATMTARDGYKAAGQLQAIGTGLEMETRTEAENGAAGETRASTPIKETTVETGRTTDAVRPEAERAASGRDSDAGFYTQARYPLNSKRLTAWHLKELARALGLPATGSTDQLRQCIVGTIQTGHDYQNVVVIVRERLMTEYVVALADSEGEFVQSNPVYRDAPPQYVHAVGEGSVVERQRQQLEEARHIIASAASRNEDQVRIIAELQEALRGKEEAMKGDFEKELASLQRQLEAEKVKARKSWKTNCEHLAEQDAIITAQEEEIVALKSEIEEIQSKATRSSEIHYRPVPVAIRTRPSIEGDASLSTRSPRTSPHPDIEEARRTPTVHLTEASVRHALGRIPSSEAEHSRAVSEHFHAVAGRVMKHGLRKSEPSECPLTGPPVRLPVTHRRQGTAPPIEYFSGEDPAVTLDDWLPGLERAASWNGWSLDDKLMQLPGYLQGRALQEWRLLHQAEQRDYLTAIEALRTRLDTGSKTVAAQEFRHAMQRTGESVSDFIRRLEKTFQIAYGKDNLNAATRDTLLYGQLYEGLCYDIMLSPAVSGSQGYRELCTAARAEERRLAALKQRQHYAKTPRMTSALTPVVQLQDTKLPRPNVTPSSYSSFDSRKCFNCGKPGHLALRCPSTKRQPIGRSATSARTTQVSSGTKLCPRHRPVQEYPPQEFLQSSDDEQPTQVKLVRIADQGSVTQCVRVQVQGVPAFGLIDSGADISIIGGTLFKKVAIVAKLKKRDLKRADKVPRTYDQKPFQLDGRMDLDITFGETTMKTPVYIKMNAHDQLLLSEGVCRQLNIIQYHPTVEAWRGGRRKIQPNQSIQRKQSRPAQLQEPHMTRAQDAQVPTVRVSLVQTVQLLPHQRKLVEVQLAGEEEVMGTYLLEPTELQCGVRADQALLYVAADVETLTVVSNPTGQSMLIKEGSMLGEATPATLVTPSADSEMLETAIEPEQEELWMRQIQSKPSAWRKRKLLETIGALETLTLPQRDEMIAFLQRHHTAFALEDDERGETDLIEMSIETGEAEPRKCAPRRMPFAVRGEVARQLQRMQTAGVIQPSSIPWASPVVMVRKKDGTHRFCIDYRQLNAVTKSDVYPLPRIDDLLDQLGQCHFFSTLDLASGYWQIRMSPSSREKTAFVTPQRLFEFLVMPFGLTNPPAVFQRLMQRVFTGLNPESGPDFVTVYIDDVLIFSRTLEEHLTHLQTVIGRIEEAGLKLKPSKCQFVRQEVEYLGHLVTPQGLKTNSRLVEAVREFPRPIDVSGVRRFLGLASYYWRFIRNFAKISEPLRELTRKDVSFRWTQAHEDALTELKGKLASAPVLAYPSFDKPFTVETDASIGGIGAILSQEDSKLHPVDYASRALSSAERNYSVTELETLAVVWALTRFHSYLYGQSVTVVTDHAAVRALLETPNPSGRHACWWTKVYGTGLKDVRIMYRAGKLNCCADALSRGPQGEAPLEGLAEQEVQVAAVRTQDHERSDLMQSETESITDLLKQQPQFAKSEDFATEQRKDLNVKEIIDFLEQGTLPPDDLRARRIALQKSLFTIEKNILFYLDPRQSHRKRAVVPEHLRELLLVENHSSIMGGHFALQKMYKALMRHWWWDGMYCDVQKFTANCPQCTVVTGGARHHRPPLHPIPVNRPFQIVGGDVMELPKTDAGNQYVLVFQDFLTK